MGWECNECEDSWSNMLWTNDQYITHWGRDKFGDNLAIPTCITARASIADDIFKRVFWNESMWISIGISLKFVPQVRINNIPALAQIMAWRRPGDKPLSESMMVSLLTHICITRSQLVKADNWLNSIWQLNNTNMRDYIILNHIIIPSNIQTLATAKHRDYTYLGVFRSNHSNPCCLFDIFITDDVEITVVAPIVYKPYWFLPQGPHFNTKPSVQVMGIPMLKVARPSYL